MDRQVYKIDEYREETITTQKKKRTTKCCNLCAAKFSTKEAHILFCNTCRERNRELLRFSEWLPEAPEGITFEDDAA